MSFEEQIIPKKKYPRIFSSQMKAIVFSILQGFFLLLFLFYFIFFRNARSFENWKNATRIFPMQFIVEQRINAEV